MKANRIVTVAAVVVLAGALGAAGYLHGRTVGKKASTATDQQLLTGQQSRSTQGGQFGTSGGGAPGGFPASLGGGGTPVPGARAMSGTIKEVRGNTIIMATADSEVEIEIGDATRITGTTDITLSDLKAGERISVAGPTSGSIVTASSISVFSGAP
jgi:hypothetical protein